MSVVEPFLLWGGKRQPRHLGESLELFGSFLGWGQGGWALWTLV